MSPRWHDISPPVLFPPWLSSWLLSSVIFPIAFLSCSYLRYSNSLSHCLFLLLLLRVTLTKKVVWIVTTKDYLSSESFKFLTEIKWQQCMPWRIKINQKNCYWAKMFKAHECCSLCLFLFWAGLVLVLNSGFAHILTVWSFKGPFDWIKTCFNGVKSNFIRKTFLTWWNSMCFELSGL